MRPENTNDLTFTVTLPFHAEISPSQFNGKPFNRPGVTDSGKVNAILNDGFDVIIEGLINVRFR